MNIKILFFSLVLLLQVYLGNAFAQNEQEKRDSTDWIEYSTFEGITVEYRYTKFVKAGAREEIHLIFRFSNTSSERRELVWVTKEYRVGECSNCERLDNPEYNRKIILDSGEMIEGDPSNSEDQNLYVFSHFVNFVEGMTEHYLTDIEFVNVEVNVIETVDRD